MRTVGRGYMCYRKNPEGRWCRGKIINAYVREGTPSKWRVVGKVCNRCYSFSPLSPSASGSGAAAGGDSAATST